MSRPEAISKSTSGTPVGATTTNSLGAAAALVDFIQNEILGTASTTTVTAEDDLLASGIVDSMGVMRLVGFIEEKYSITVPPEDVTIENFLTITLIAAFIKVRLAAVSEEIRGA